MSPARASGKAESGFYGRYAPPRQGAGEAPQAPQAPQGQEARAPAGPAERPPEAFESPGMAKLNANHRLNWILNAERLAEDEAAAAGAAMRRAIASEDPSAASESVVLTMRAVSTIQRLFDATRDPLWFHLATEWRHVQGLMHELQVALSGKPGRDADEESLERRRAEVRQLREDIEQSVDEAGARMSEIFISERDVDEAREARTAPPAPPPQGHGPGRAAA